ncbi:hypothetical protein H0E87_022351, partial [Populus deltoides]
LYADQLRVIVGHLDVMGAPGVQAASLSPSVSHDMESYMKSRDDNFLQLIQNSNPFDAQPPMVFYPEQSSHLTNLLERKYSNGYSTDLQVYYEPRPLDDQLPNAHRTSSYLHAMEDAIMKMVCDQNTSDEFGCKLSSSSNLPCANRTSWMWDNVWFNNADSSVSYNKL